MGTGSGLGARSATVFGLTGIAVTQPLLDLFGRNPEFFVVGRYATSTIVLFALVVALVPGLVASAIVVVAHRAHPRAGALVYAALVAALGGLVGDVVIRGVGVDRMLGSAVAGLAGAALALGLTRVPPGRLLLQYLAAGNALFLVGFLVLSPTGDLVFGGTSVDLGHVEVPSLPGPVVVVVLDEFPVTTLMTADGSINAERFPAFAALAQESTWFRNASSHHSLTHLAVPAILTGVLPGKKDLPDIRDHPRNLFTLLGRDVPVDRYELVTDMCPSEICEPKPRESLGQALRDASVVYGHRALPARLRTGLPDIDHSWGGFGNELGDAAASEPAETPPDISAADPFARWHSTSAAQRHAPAQAAVLGERAEAIGPGPGLHFIHVALPHFPWILTPWGTRLMESPRRVTERSDPAYDWSARQQYQLQSMQSGAADVAIGRLVRHLKENGTWKDATVVVMSDHGMGLTAPDFGRTPTPSNTQELYRIPLFVKAPGQTTGTPSDAPAQSIDVLPSLVDLLHITTDWDFDGHSLFDHSRATVEPLVGRSFAPALEVVARHLEDVPGTSWTGLAAVGEHADLVGRPLDELRIGPVSDLTWRPDHQADFASLPTAAGAAPQLLTGVVQGSAGRPPELVVAVNGTIAGTLGGYEGRGDAWRFTAFLGPFLRTGANDIRAFEVTQVAGATVVHEVR